MSRRSIPILLVCLLFSISFPIESLAEGIRAPFHMDMGDDGGLFVTDPALKQVVKVDLLSLNPITGFSIIGGGYPYAVGVIPQGDGTNFIITSNTTTRRVEVYNEGGVFQYPFAGTFGWVRDIAVDADTDRVFIINGGRRTVEAYTVAGVFVNFVPATRRNYHYLGSPSGLTVDRLNEVLIVSDQGAPRRSRPQIQVFTYDGNLLTSFPWREVWPAPVRKQPQPEGITTDTAGNIYFVDSGIGKVLGFNRFSREKLPTITHPPLSYPMDIALDPDTRDLFVLNVYNEKLIVIRDGAALP
jgi:DNA-binding beta-propeller fold protein YncE